MLYLVNSGLIATSKEVILEIVRLISIIDYQHHSNDDRHAKDHDQRSKYPRRFLPRQAGGIGLWKVRPRRERGRERSALQFARNKSANGRQPRVKALPPAIQSARSATGKSRPANT